MTSEDYNKIFQEQLEKDPKMAELDKWFNEHPSYGYYFYYDENANEFFVGDAYGPMNSNRFRKIDKFYENEYKILNKK